MFGHLRLGSDVLGFSLAVALVLTSSVHARQGQQPPQAPPPQPPQAAPQAPPPQQPIFRTGVRLVRVDATVLGKGDQPAAGLQAADFEVTEDGVTQRVEQLQFIKLDGERPAGDERSLEIRSQEQAEAEAAREDIRVFAIFLDDYHIDKAPSITIPLRRSLSRLIDSFWPTDLVALMDPLTPLSALRFTRAKSELHAVVSQFEGRQGEIFPVKSVIEEAQLGRGDLYRVRAEVTLSALHALVVRLGGLREGRKTVIFVSQGPPTQFGREGNIQDIMRDIAQAANRGNVTIDPVDPRGLGSTARGVSDTLYQLAAETGGRAIIDTNDPMIGLERALRDTTAYYVLGYTPTRTQDDGRYHKINVKVKRPGMHVLARQGYWAPSSKELETARAAAEKVPEPGVTRALDALARLEPTRRPVDVWIGVSRGGDGRSRVTVAWEPGETAPGRATPATLDVEAIDEGTGAVLEAARPAPPTTAGQTQAPLAFLLKPGQASMRFTARAADGAPLGSWSESVAVPDFSTAPEIALSTPRLYRARSLQELRALQAAPDSAPNASRRFSRSDRVLVALDCYTSSPEPAPAIDGYLLSRDGRELSALPLPAPKEGALRFELPVGSLGIGTYLLRIRAHSGDKQAEQIAGFSVTR